MTRNGASRARKIQSRGQWAVAIVIATPLAFALVLGPMVAAGGEARHRREVENAWNDYREAVVYYDILVSAVRHVSGLESFRTALNGRLDATQERLTIGDLIGTVAAQADAWHFLQSPFLWVPCGPGPRILVQVAHDFGHATAATFDNRSRLHSVGQLVGATGPPVESGPNYVGGAALWAQLLVFYAAVAQGADPTLARRAPAPYSDDELMRQIIARTPGTGVAAGDTAAIDELALGVNGGARLDLLALVGGGPLDVTLLPASLGERGFEPTPDQMQLCDFGTAFKNAVTKWLVARRAILGPQQYAATISAPPPAQIPGATSIDAATAAALIGPASTRAGGPAVSPSNPVSIDAAVAYLSTLAAAGWISTPDVMSAMVAWAIRRGLPVPRFR